MGPVILALRDGREEFGAWGRLGKLYTSMRTKACARANKACHTSSARPAQVPASYPFVMLAAGALAFIVNFVLGGQVMAARSTYNIPLPNLYATPGYHDKADEFNRVQRGHQNMLGMPIWGSTSRRADHRNLLLTHPSDPCLGQRRSRR